MDFDISILNSHVARKYSQLLFIISFLLLLYTVKSEYIVLHTNKQTKTILRINRDDSTIAFLDDQSKKDFTQLKLFNFSVPKADPKPCIRMESSFYFVANYSMLLLNGSSTTNFVLFNLTDESNNFTYTGFCQKDRINIEITFLQNWRLEFYFYKEESTFLLKHVILYYKLTGPLFPHSLHEGGQSEVYDYPFVNSTLHKSYKCNEGLQIDLGEVTLHMKHLLIEPFFDNRRTPHHFDAQHVCLGDLEKPPEASWENSIILILLGGLLFVIAFSCVFFMYLKFTSKSKSDYNIISKAVEVKKRNLDDDDMVKSAEWHEEWVRRV